MPLAAAEAANVDDDDAAEDESEDLCRCFWITPSDAFELDLDANEVVAEMMDVTGLNSSAMSSSLSVDIPRGSSSDSSLLSTNKMSFIVDIDSVDGCIVDGRRIIEMLEEVA